MFQPTHGQKIALAGATAVIGLAFLTKGHGKTALWAKTTIPLLPGPMLCTSYYAAKYWGPPIPNVWFKEGNYSGNLPKFPR